MASVLDIISGISTVMANSHDGALDEDGIPIEVGLKREEGDPIVDSRVIDGFKVQFIGPILRIRYTCQLELRQVHNTNKFEGEIEQTISDIAQFIKKEYKKATGSALSLTAQGEPKILVQNMSRLRTWVIAHMDYLIGGMTDVTEVGAPKERTVDDAIKTWLGSNGNLKRSTGTGMLGKDSFPGAGTPKNVTGKRDEEPR